MSSVSPSKAFNPGGEHDQHQQKGRAAHRGRRDQQDQPRESYHASQRRASRCATQSAGDSMSAANKYEPSAKPRVLLPGGRQSITATATTLGQLLAETGRYYYRGGTIVKYVKNPDGFPELEEVRPVALPSIFESVSMPCKGDSLENAKPATCPEQTARLISAAASFRDALPIIRVLAACPVLTELGGRLIEVSGFDLQSGIMAAGQPVERIETGEAVRLLNSLLVDFRFATPADRARALAAMVTPALVFGGLLRGRAPIDLGEADASQTGKGFRNKISAALYGQNVRAVAQKKGGVGSLEESFDMALIRGANFISLDNVRGRIDSPKIESFMTEDTYNARSAYSPNVEIDPRRVVLMMTSNKADVTSDFANRCSCVRLLKQPESHDFKKYPEGDILEYVRANQPRFLGAVFSVVRAWHEAGKPRTAETRHDFRPWAQTLDWITRNIFDAGPLLDGHRETQERMTNPVLNWLRDCALEVIRQNQGGVWLRAGNILELIAASEVETPGLPEHADPSDPEIRKAALQAMGRKMGLCFRTGDNLTLDGMEIERREEYDPMGRYAVKEYCFHAAASAAMHPPSIAAKSGQGEPSTASGTELDPENGTLQLWCGYAAAMESADETRAAANAANTLQHISDSNHSKDSNICTIGTHSRIAATTAPPGTDISETTAVPIGTESWEEV